MKKICLFMLLIMTLGVNAGVPKYFNYHGVVSEKDQLIVVRVSIIDITEDPAIEGDNHPIVYSETHQVRTSLVGAFNLKIGYGAPVGDTRFEDINWSEGTYGIKVMTDSHISVFPLASVPFAMVAESVPAVIEEVNSVRENIESRLDEMDAELKNKFEDIDDILATIGSKVEMKDTIYKETECCTLVSLEVMPKNVKGGKIAINDKNLGFFNMWIAYFDENGSQLDFWGNDPNSETRVVSVPANTEYYTVYIAKNVYNDKSLSIVSTDGTVLYPIKPNGLKKDVDSLKEIIESLKPEPEQKLPDYYFPYLSDKVAEIETYWKECSANTSAFFFITDMHYTVTMNRNAGFSIAMIKYIRERLHIDTVVNGGDVFDVGVFRNVVRDLADAVGSNKVYSTYGNHEFINYQPYNTVAYDFFLPNGMIYGDTEKRYGYVDDPDMKIRFINLCSFGVRETVGGQYSNPLALDEQYAWFVNKALDLPDGFTAVVYSHSLYTANDQTKALGVHSNAQRYIDAIDANPDKIQCVLMGHTHWDKMHLGTTGVPYIISQCDQYTPYPPQGDYADINVERILGTISEQHFEVVLIDKTARKIRMFAIGSQSRDGYDNEEGTLCDYRETIRQ